MKSGYNVVFRFLSVGLLILCFHFNMDAQQEKEIKSKISKVTLFSKGAQIESESTFELQQGKTLLSFKNLSPYIHKESIRIDGDGSYTLLNVQLNNDYLNELEKNKETIELNNSIDQFKIKIEDEENLIKIMNEKLDFLKANKNISGKDQTINPESFKSLYQVYGDNIEKYSIEILKKNRLIKDYVTEVEKLKNQLNSASSRNGIPSGTITILVDSKQLHNSKIRLAYIVDNASWYPSYDIRFTSTNKPLTITFKANMIQNTGVDWKNVELKLSTAKTSISAQIPTLSTNYLQFYYPSYSSEVERNNPEISISNTLGDAGSSGKVSIRGLSSFKSNNNYYIVDGVPMSDVSSLDPKDILDVKVLKGEEATALYGSRASDGVIVIQTRDKQDQSSLPTGITEKNEISNEYSVDAQQSLNTDNKLNSISFKETELIANYEYQAIPKLIKSVFLIGKVGDWSKADLIDGEASVYLENSFVGKSRISTQQFTDTLDISFGIDNNIIVNREKIKDFSEVKSLGSNKKETYAWRLSIRNNKSYTIKAKLIDQVPVSSVKDIQVENLELSGGVMSPNTGKIQWILEVKPGETKQVVLKYSVKYPKDKLVKVE